MEENTLVDMVSPEGIRVFRLEKLAQTCELVVTDSLFQGLKSLLYRYRIEAQPTKLKEPLKGFYNQDWFPPFYRLLIMPESADVSNILERCLDELEKEVQSIPVFGRIYPPVPMEKNFINLALGWQSGQDRDSRDRSLGGALPKAPGERDKKRKRRGLQDEKDAWLDHEWDRESADEAREIRGTRIQMAHELKRILVHRLHRLTQIFKKDLPTNYELSNYHEL